MSVLWTCYDALIATRALGGRCIRDWQATGVSIDSRDLTKGDLFVALKDCRDGHDFVAQAFKKGAVAALVSRLPNGVDFNAPLLVVDDVTKGLVALACFARKRMFGGVIAITGSVGKTSSKEMLRTVLSAQARVSVSERSFNNHWGVPLSLARMPANSDYAVFEIGMNQPGEIAPLARMIDIDVAIVTTVTPAHFAAFEDIKALGREKANIFQGLRCGGTAVINFDIATAPILITAARKMGAKIIGFGYNEASAFRLIKTQVEADFTYVQAQIYGKKVALRLGIPAKYFAMNALAILAAVDAVGANLTTAIKSLSRIRAISGRGTRQQIQLAKNDTRVLELIDESYNASPASMQAVLDTFATLPKMNGRKVAILGDMLELGKNARAFHIDLADLSALKHIDIIHTVGKLMAYLHAELPVAKRGQCVQTAQQLVEKIHLLVAAGDLVMVKGSNGLNLVQIVRAIQSLRKE